MVVWGKLCLLSLSFLTACHHIGPPCNSPIPTLLTTKFFRATYFFPLIFPHGAIEFLPGWIYLLQVFRKRFHSLPSLPPISHFPGYFAERKPEAEPSRLSSMYLNHLSIGFTIPYEDDGARDLLRSRVNPFRANDFHVFSQLCKKLLLFPYFAMKTTRWFSCPGLSLVHVCRSSSCRVQLWILGGQLQRAANILVREMELSLTNHPEGCVLCQLLLHVTLMTSTSFGFCQFSWPRRSCDHDVGVVTMAMGVSMWVPGSQV